MSDEQDKRAWDRGWDEHQRQQQRRLAQLSLYEKILWLEEAQKVAEHLKRQRDAQSRGETGKRGQTTT